MCYPYYEMFRKSAVFFARQQIQLKFLLPNQIGAFIQIVEGLIFPTAAGVKTEAKDTLFLLDCPMGHLVREGWESITDEDLKVDGLKKKPVFVIVNSKDEFLKLIVRIEGKLTPTSLKPKSLYQY